MIFVHVSSKGKYKGELIVNAPQLSAEVDDSSPIAAFTQVNAQPLDVGNNADDMCLFSVISGDTALQVAVTGANGDPDTVEPIIVPANYAYTGLLSGKDAYEIHVKHNPEA